MDDCIFCRIVEGKLPASVVCRDDLCMAFMDIHPVNAGHVLIIPTDHVAFLADLEEDTGAHLFRLAQRIAAVLPKCVSQCEGINMFLADGEAAGQEVFHLHLHVFPRYRGDQFGFLWSSSISHIPERNELDNVAGTIRRAMDL
ncbi:MAG: HIT family protein [Deltaproteobacteria bacterium]|nr:HIT family protein [Deltaproteobacteria bacterium]MBN2688306.1 HIT family protein [Deltaproteobacteria bacterium]